MNTKIKNLTNRQINEICKKNIYINCSNCPLNRYNKDTHRQALFCYKKLRAEFYALKLQIQSRIDLTDEDKDYIIEQYRKDQEEIEEEEIEL